MDPSFRFRDYRKISSPHKIPLSILWQPARIGFNEQAKIGKRSAHRTLFGKRGDRKERETDDGDLHGSRCRAVLFLFGRLRNNASDQVFFRTRFIPNVFLHPRERKKPSSTQTVFFPDLLKGRFDP